MTTYKNKKVFVTGHTGFKGSWLTQWLLELGAEVTGYSIDIPTHPSLFEALNLHKKIKHIEGDVRDFDKLKSALYETQPQFVFHLAAQAYVRKSYDLPKDTFDVNSGGTINVLEAIRHISSVKAAVIVTTDKCYENLEQNKAFTEGDKLGGHDPYSASKACAEIITHAYIKSFFQSQNGAKIATARGGNVIGGGDWSDDRIIPDCVKHWSQNKSVTLRNPSSTRPWQHVLDCLSGYLALGENLFLHPEKCHGEAFNFGPESSGESTVLELVKELQQTWPLARFEIDEKTNQSKRESHFLKLSCKKSHEILNWAPRMSHSETIKNTALWYKNYYENQNSAIELTRRQIRDYQAP